MFIFVNSQKRELSKKVTLSYLVHDLNLEARSGIAIAVNNTVVPQSEWSAYQLSDRDRVAIIEATAGG